MKLHDHMCQEFEFDHTPGNDVNPEVWNIPKGEALIAPYDAPVSGWRFIVIHHVGGEVIHAGGLNGEYPSPWPGLLAAPRAECEPDQMVKRAMGSTLGDSMRRAASHGHSPDPSCECGYRVVRDVGELSRYMRWQPWVTPDYPVSDLPDGVRELVEPWGDTVTQSVVIASVVGCGLVAGADYEHYQDPDGTVRVEWLGSACNFIADAHDPVVQVLRDWGATVSAVPDVRGVHEVGGCGSLSERFRFWKPRKPASVTAP